MEVFVITGNNRLGVGLCSKDHEIIINGLSALLCTIIVSSLGGGSLGRPATSGVVRSCGGLMNNRVWMGVTNPFHGQPTKMST